jgi:hypothetical protein
MEQTKENQIWLKIRAENAKWFSTDTLRFFGSKIYWQTLTEIDGGYLFITAEDNYDRSVKLFSLRFVDVEKNYAIDTLGEFNGYETLRHAKTALKNVAGFSQFLGKVGA